MKKILAFLVLAMGTNAAYAQYGSYPSNGSSSNQYDQSQGQQQPMQQPSMVPSDCSHLSQQEQAFSSQLSVMHRTMFCRHFSVSQRIEAMTLATAGAQGLTGNKSEITPDEAVEVVMKNARQTPPATSNAPKETEQQNPYGGSYRYPSRSSLNR